MNMFKILTIAIILQVLPVTGRADFRACQSDAIWTIVCAPEDQIIRFCSLRGSNPETMKKFRIDFEEMRDRLGLGNAATAVSGGILRGPFICN